MRVGRVGKCGQGGQIRDGKGQKKVKKGEGERST
jgi:hypothetical protein